MLSLLLAINDLLKSGEAMPGLYTNLISWHNDLCQWYVLDDNGNNDRPLWGNLSRDTFAEEYYYLFINKQPLSPQNCLLTEIENYNICVLAFPNKRYPLIQQEYVYIFDTKIDMHEDPSLPILTEFTGQINLHGRIEQVYSFHIHDLKFCDKLNSEISKRHSR
jgi:hypothetical protein